MRKKHRRSLLVTALAYLYLAQCGSVFSAASGNYTDLLPVGAAGNTTVISNGSGWSLTTLPPTQTFGDALSRVVTTVYQSTATATISGTVTVSTITALRQGNVGSTTFPAAWVATGRSIVFEASGKYSTQTAADTQTWALLLGTTTILTTNALTHAGNQTGQYWRARGTMTIAATGNTGTVNASYEIFESSAATAGSANVISFSTATAAAVTVDLTSQLTVNPTFKWGTTAAGNSLLIDNAVVQFLN